MDTMKNDSFSNNKKNICDDLKKIFSDDELLKRLLELKKSENVKIELDKKNIQLTLDEIRLIGKFLAVSINSDGKIKENFLKKISGGGFPILSKKSTPGEFIAYPLRAVGYTLGTIAAGSGIIGKVFYNAAYGFISGLYSLTIKSNVPGIWQ